MAITTHRFINRYGWIRIKRSRTRFGRELEIAFFRWGLRIVWYPRSRRL